jgi:hypothetical protein
MTDTAPLSNASKLKIAGSIAALVVAGVVFVMFRGGEDAAEATRRRTVIDSKTNKVYQIRLTEGTRAPWKNPETGEETLYPAEACYWNKDGTAKLEPTYVFVKEYAGIDEDTFCPDCGRRVVPHNPMPPDHLLVEAAERAKASGGS